MTEYFFKCDECGYDSKEAGKLAITASPNAICPLCAGDNGRDVPLTFREATEAEKLMLPTQKVILG